MKKYQLGLSDQVFNQKNIQNYLKRDVVFGWLGHENRTADLDKIIEEGLRERGIEDEYMHSWFSSTHGRHFADELYSVEFTDRQQYVKDNLDLIHDKCLIYSDSSHHGFLVDTLRIQDELLKQGKLLCKY